MFMPIERIYAMHQQIHKPNERSHTSGVEPMMDRVKVTIAALLPALLLLASGQYLLGDVHASCNSSACTIQDGSNCDSHPLCPPDTTARLINLRLAKHFGKAYPQVQEPISSKITLERSIRAVFTENQSPSSSSTWQFACRAAGNPRAPSSVS